MAKGPAEESAMYAAIRSQPAVVAAVLADASGEIARAAAVLASARRVWLVGTGTSSHAAIVGEHLLRAAGVDAYAGTAFDLATYPRQLEPGDAVIAISHRGSKRYGLAAIARARAVGVPVVGVTGQDSPMEDVTARIATAPQEVSSTHTVSYTANLAALAGLAARLGAARGRDVAELDAALSVLPAAMAALLEREAAVRPFAIALAARERILLVGAGPHAATAREGALKIKESSYLVAEGCELEAALHGFLPAVAPEDLAVVIAAQGPALERTADLLGALAVLGTRTLIVADERAAGALHVPDRPADATLLTYAAVPEALSPILAVIPLQLLAVFTAEWRGTDPDSFRADEPIYKQATDSYRL